jgi:PAS domain S-box-containing protein
VKKLLFLSLLFTHSFLHADGFGTLLMSATLFILLLTLIIALTVYLKNLQKENLRYRSYFQRTETATLFIDAKGVVRDLNISTQELLGYTKEQLINQKWYDKLLPDEAALPIKHRIYHADNKKEDTTKFNAPLVSANGDVLEAAFTLAPFPEPLKGSVLTLMALR